MAYCRSIVCGVFLYADIIPRRLIFGNPDITHLKISLDGQYISYMASLSGTMNIYIARVDHIYQALPVTHYAGGNNIKDYRWTYNGNILYLYDNNGDENYHVHYINLEQLKIIDLTPFSGVKAAIVHLSPFFPEEVLITMNQRCREHFDIYKINLSDFSRTKILNNDELLSFIFDDQYNLRFTVKRTLTGHSMLYKVIHNNYSLPLMSVSAGDKRTTKLLDFDKNGKVYMIDSTDRNTAALMLLDPENSIKTMIYENGKVDLSAIMIHPLEKRIQAIKYHYFKSHTMFVDTDMMARIIMIEKYTHHALSIVDRSYDDTIWLMATVKDDAPTSYWLYQKKIQSVSFLFHSHYSLAEYKDLFTKMHPISITTRDGLEMVSYLSLPMHFDNDLLIFDYAIPMVLWVHGGPEERDIWGFRPIHQWLANRGYAVLSVNYRGSSGFGKEFVKAGDGEWSRKMHDDLIDAVNWAVKQGIAHKDKIAIAGSSYGGYAALVGLTFTPDVFACGIDISGPSNLEALLESIPPYWKPYVDELEKKMGGSLRTEALRNELRDRSPINFIDKVKRPLLIAQGANDPRVKKSQSDQMVSALISRNVSTTYIVYHDEGHNFMKQESRISLFAVAEAFLSKHLGGLLEPMDELINGSLDGSNFEIVAGKEILEIL